MSLAPDTSASSSGEDAWYLISLVITSMSQTTEWQRAKALKKSKCGLIA